MTPDKRLSNISVKIERARKHFTELELEVKAFLDSKPYQVGVKRNVDTQQLVYYVSSVKSVPPIIAAITGDVVHNLRSALDHLAYHLVDVGTCGKGPFRHVYFPIYANAKEYKKQRHEKVQGMRQDAVKAIDALQPYKGGNDSLWQLVKLDNTDKHRLLLTVGSRFESVNIGSILHRLFEQTASDVGLDVPTFDLFIKPADRLFPLKVGDELFIDAPGAEVDPKMQFRFDVGFAEPQVIEDAHLTETVRHMTDLVDSIVVSFRPLLG